MAEIIAELCQNHLGDRRLLLEMVWAAAEAGATIAKIQSIWAEDLTYRERFETGVVDAAGRTQCIKRPYGPEYRRLRPLNLSAKDHWAFVQECEKARIVPMTTVFARSRIRLVQEAGFRYVKVASYDCASLSLLRELRARFETLYVSTGATYDQEVEEAANVLAGTDFTFLHCVTIYPTPFELLNLGRMAFLRKYTSKVGFSDHTLVERDGLKAAVAALYLGADVVERHFTLLPRDRTRDGPVSITSGELRELVAFASMTAAELKEVVGKLVPEFPSLVAPWEMSREEKLNRDYYRGRFASFLPSAPMKPVYNWDDSVSF